MTDEKRILIAEDEEGFADFLESLLKSRGYRVTVTHDGEEGLKELSKGDPDLMILDMRMPKIGGVELYTRICKPYGRSRFPVIILTALEGLSDFFREIMVDAFLTKPVDANELLKKVDALIRSEGNPVLYHLSDRGDDKSRELNDILIHERYGVENFGEAEQIIKALNVRQADFILAEDKMIMGRKSWLKEMRRETRFRDVPLIVYSKVGGVESEAVVLAEGATCYAGELSDITRILATIRRFHREKMKKEQA